jgi:glutamate dehydrogenase (NADP+)
VQILKDANVVFVPGKAANAGGVAVSGLEMAQNGSCQSWSEEKVDTSLHQIMEMIHSTCLEVAMECGRPGDYVTGANVAGFKKVADAMIDQGVV